MPIIELCALTFGLLSGGRTVAKIRRDWREGSRTNRDRTSSVSRYEADSYNLARQATALSTIASSNNAVLTAHDNNRTIIHRSNNHLLERLSDNYTALQRNQNEMYTNLQRNQNEMYTTLQKDQNGMYTTLQKDQNGMYLSVQQQQNRLVYDILSLQQEERKMFFNQLRLDRQMIITLLVLIAGLMFLVGKYSAQVKYLERTYLPFIVMGEQKGPQLRDPVEATEDLFVTFVQNCFTFAAIALTTFVAICSIFLVSAGIWWTLTSILFFLTHVVRGVVKSIVDSPPMTFLAGMVVFSQVVRALVRYQLGLSMPWILVETGWEVLAMLGVSWMTIVVAECLEGILVKRKRAEAVTLLELLLLGAGPVLGGWALAIWGASSSTANFIAFTTAISGIAWHF